MLLLLCISPLHPLQFGGSLRLAIGLPASVPGEVASTGLAWRRKGSLMVSVPHELGGVYPQLGGGIRSRLDVFGNRERWRDFEQGCGKTQKVLKGTLVLAGNRQTSCSYVHSFLPSSFTPSPLCLSYRSHPQDAQSGGRQKGLQHAKKHQRVKERTSSWRTQGHFPEGAPF